MIAIVDYGAGNIRSVLNALRRSLDSLALARDDNSLISTEAARPSGEPFGMRSPTGRAQIFSPEEIVLTADTAVLRAADKVILPGVGEASTAMKALSDCGLAEFIPTLTQPVLGICIGAQLMCRSSEEGGARCMGIFSTDVRRFDAAAGEKIPHMGWNSLFAPAPLPSRPTGETPVSSCPGAGEAPMSSRSTDPVSSRAQSRDLSSPLFKGLPEGSYVYFVHSFYPELCPDTIAVSHHGVDFSAALAKDNFFACQFHPEKSGAVGETILRNFLSL